MKLRGIRPGRDDNLNRLRRSLSFVILLQPFSETVGLYANDRVALLVEVRVTSKSLDRDVVLFDVVGFALEIFAADITQKNGQAGRTIENSARKETFNRCAFGFEVIRGCGISRRSGSAH